MLEVLVIKLACLGFASFTFLSFMFSLVFIVVGLLFGFCLYSLSWAFLFHFLPQLVLIGLLYRHFSLGLSLFYFSIIILGL
jgi:hypothetical protein